MKKLLLLFATVALSLISHKSTAQNYSNDIELRQLVGEFDYCIIYQNDDTLGDFVSEIELYVDHHNGLAYYNIDEVLDSKQYQIKEIFKFESYFEITTTEDVTIYFMDYIGVVGILDTNSEIYLVNSILYNNIEYPIGKEDVIEYWQIR